MKPTDKHTEISTRIDSALRNDDFLDAPLIHDGRRTKHASWYSQLLTTLTLVVGEQSIEYSQTDYDAHGGTVRFVLFTKQAVIVVDAEGIADDRPKVATQLVGRRSLTSIAPTASMSLNQEGSKAYGWPGQVQITAHYSGLAAPLVLAEQARNNSSNEPSPILALLVALQGDLNG